MICSTPQTLTVALAGTGDTSITLAPGESVNVEAIYTTDDNPHENCTHTLNFAAVKPGVAPQSFATQLAAAEDTTYTKAFTPSSRGTWTVSASLVWSSENPPVDANVMASGNTLTVTSWVQTAEVDSELETRTATSGVADRSTSAEIETRTTTAGVESRATDAELETRSATRGLEE